MRAIHPSFSRDFYQDDKEGHGSGLCERCMMDEAFNAPTQPLPSADHDTKVCRRGEGRDCCIFLVVAPGSESMFQCANHSGLNNTLVNKALKKEMGSRCINCEGPPSWEPKNPPFDYDKNQEQKA